MIHKRRQTDRMLLTIGFLLLPTFSACNFVPATETADPNVVITFAAETISANERQQTFDAMQALLTSQALTMQAPTATFSPTDTLIPTQPPPAATATTAPPTAPAPTVVIVTATPSILMLTADIDTRCRQGPSTAFATVSFILVGQQSPIIGQNPERTWWLIQDPQGRFGNCWAWGETTRPIGDASNVPVIQPPPLPTQQVRQDFQLSYSNLHICGGVAMATFQVVNTGTVGFQSSNITIRDITNNVGLAGPEASNTPFLTGSNNCPPGFSTLPAGSSGFVTKGIGALPPSGTRGRGIVVLCTQANLNGTCVEQRATFTFP